MFVEGLIESRALKLDRRRILLLPLVVGLHAAVLGALLVGSIWNKVYINVIPVQVADHGFRPPGIPMGGNSGDHHHETHAVHPKAVHSVVAPWTVPTDDLRPIPAEGEEERTDEVEGGFDTEGLYDAPGGGGGKPWDGPMPERPRPLEDDTPQIVGGDIQAPVRLSELTPCYSEAARKAGIQGMVILQLTVDRYGRVQDVSVLRGLSMGLTDCAVEAARRQVFNPAVNTRIHAPVACLFTLTVSFHLN